MRMHEIVTQYIQFGKLSSQLLESYSNPDVELSINFRLIDSEFGTNYYKAEVFEKSTNDKLLFVSFDLNDKVMNIGNVVPDPKKVTPGKVVHTTVGDQTTGIDMGHTAMHWVLRKMRDFAKSEGFNIRQIKSVSRYTGARAKLNQNGDDEAKSFGLNVNVNESFVYHCDTDTLIVNK